MEPSGYQEKQAAIKTHLLENGWVVRYPKTAKGEEDKKDMFWIRKNLARGAEEPDGLEIKSYKDGISICAQFNHLDIHIGDVTSKVGMDGHPFNGERGGKVCFLKCEDKCELDVVFSNPIVVSVTRPSNLPITVDVP